MRNDLEIFLLKHGPYWVVALLGVIIQKMFAKETTTLFKIFRSALSVIVVTSIFINLFETDLSSGWVWFYVLVIGLSIDFIIIKLIETGPSIINRFFSRDSKNE